MFFDRSHIELIIISLVAIFLFIIIIKPLREIAIWFFKDIFLPSIFWFFNYVILFIVKQFKEVLLSHAHLLKNLFASRAVIFPTLDDQRKDRDKSMNRK